jgi:hypothetical protein
MTAELSQYDLIPLIISSIAVIISIFAFINARQYTIIEIFIKMVDAFFTLETRKARLDLMDNDKFTELKDEDPSILVKKEGLSEKEREDVWELVSSYNRLGFVLQNYPRVFLFLKFIDQVSKVGCRGSD